MEDNINNPLSNKYQPGQALHSFVDALEAARQGSLICRACWIVPFLRIPTQYVFIRPSEELNPLIIQRINFWPDSVKDFIKNANVPVEFKEYLCLMKNGLSKITIYNGWVPTQEDIMADDWIIGYKNGKVV